MQTNRTTLPKYAKLLSSLVLSCLLLSAEFSWAESLTKSLDMPDKAIPFGAAINPFKMDEGNKPNIQYRQAYKQYCQQIVPETGMKWKDIQKEQGVFDFRLADKVVNFGRDNGLSVRGHALVWDCENKMPEWVNDITDAEQARRALINHINKVMGRYKDTVHSWDVVNEPITEGLTGTCQKRSIWADLLKEEYIEIALRTARAVSPNAQLVINELDLVVETKAAKKRRPALLALIKNLKDKKVPIDAVGLQSHLYGHKPIAVDELRKFVSDLAKQDVKVLITELDIKDHSMVDDIDARDEKMATMVSQLLNAVGTADAILTWGITDKYTELSNTKKPFTRNDARPLPLDKNYAPKPMMHVIQNFRRGRP